MKRNLTRVSAIGALPLFAAFSITHAQTDVVTTVNPDPDPDKGHASNYWTPERFNTAKPFPMPKVKRVPDMKRKGAPGAKTSDQPASSDAQAPSEEPVSAAEQRDAIKQPRDK